MINSSSPAKGQLRSIQFHPSLSYEDFVRGYRPTNDGLQLIDGIFLQITEAAASEPNQNFILIIEEINRGNPSQIFGEMLTLIENTKRSEDNAIELSYRKSPEEIFFIPENVYIIGTMNIADKSLALLDFALRRRFSFFSLAPLFNQNWQDWCREKGFNQDIITDIQTKIIELNNTIIEDPSLGKQFCLGHSYLTPSEKIDTPKQWFRDIIESDISPLLEEYWFDDPIKQEMAVEKLLHNL